jgi:hypothetical protein
MHEHQDALLRARDAHFLTQHHALLSHKTLAQQMVTQTLHYTEQSALQSLGNAFYIEPLSLGRS